FLIVMVMLNATRWGLNLKAVGKNMRSALLLGVATERTSMSAFLVCGALAGMAGSYRVLFTFDNLRPLASGGIGFLGLLVVLLLSIRLLWVPLIAFAFAAILTGSTRLQIALKLDSSLAGVLQGMLVLFVILFHGVQEVFFPQTLEDEDALVAPHPPAPSPTGREREYRE
ncbi:MAG: ABC transporter permease, partial [Chloroflexi bacterium]|nr:ABC transporter permease [Chloroflexota bacterium]